MVGRRRRLISSLSGTGPVRFSGRNIRECRYLFLGSGNGRVMIIQPLGMTKQSGTCKKHGDPCAAMHIPPSDSEVAYM